MRDMLAAIQERKLTNKKEKPVEEARLDDDIRLVFFHPLSYFLLYVSFILRL